MFNWKVIQKTSCMGKKIKTWMVFYITIILKVFFIFVSKYKLGWRQKLQMQSTASRGQSLHRFTQHCISEIVRLKGKYFLISII